ncbi:hypothetical protein TNCV_4552961 [Trichonephila clavipes]|nr:hypothetical protein TNCV_4552961 [Trichonephila clavipes]
MSSTGGPFFERHNLSNVHFFAPEEIEAQGRADKYTDKQVFTGFDKMNNVVSLINFGNTGQDNELAILPHVSDRHLATKCLFKNIRFHCQEGRRSIDIYSW